MRRLSVLALIVSVILAAGGCLDDIEEVSMNLPAGDVPAPAGLRAEVGDGKVTLRWTGEDEADSYRVYRAIGEVGSMRGAAVTDDTFHVDNNVQNGQLYRYSVSSLGSHGLEGSLSGEIRAVPSVYSVLIAGGAEYTGERDVLLSLTAPAGTAFMMISNDPALSGAAWESYTPFRNWELEAGDGIRTVYAVFQDASGYVSPAVEDEIVLDTYTKIIGLAITPSETEYSIGADVHFTLNVEGDETGGDAEVLVEGFSGGFGLNDNGNGGDASAGDGVYEADITFPRDVRGVDLLVMGFFSDRAGNNAPIFEADFTLSFSDTPEPVQLLGVMDSTISSITIRWEASDEEYFRYYRIYRDTVTGVQEVPEKLIRELTGIAQTSYPDGNLIEGQKYYYILSVVNDLDQSAPSDELEARTHDTYPDPVVLDTLSAVGTDRLTLTWSRNSNTDFESYRIYRSTSPGVTETSFHVVTITDQDLTYHDDEDSGLDIGTNTYYYRVLVYDKGGKHSRSNEVSTAP